MILVGAAVVLLALLPVVIIVGGAGLLAIRWLERRDVPEVARPDPVQVQRLRCREDEFALNPFGALGVVKDGWLRATTVKIVLVGISLAASYVFTRGSLAGVTTIHAARWVPLDEGRRMIFASCYDGSLESYMNDFIDKLAWGLNVIFSNGVGYPRTRWLIFGAARDEQSFKDDLRRHQLETAVSYAAHPTLTAAKLAAAAERVDRLAVVHGAVLLQTLETHGVGDFEPFGFRDGISQPYVPELASRSDDASARPVALGEFLLGYPNAYGRFTRRPVLADRTDPWGCCRGWLQAWTTDTRRVVPTWAATGPT